MTSLFGCNRWRLGLLCWVLAPALSLGAAQPVSLAFSGSDIPREGRPGSMGSLYWDENDLRYRVGASPGVGDGALRLGRSHRAVTVDGGEQWQFGLDFDAILTPQESREIQGFGHQQRSADLGVERFLLSGRTERLSFRLGHHQATDDGLLFEGAAHWGLSARARLDGINSELSLFGVNAASGEDPLAGFARADSEDYFSGGAWQSSLATPWVGMTLSASYVAGRENAGGFPGSPLEDSTVGVGEGYSVGLDSQWFDQRLNLSLESALTRFTPEQGSGDALSPSDNAYSATLIYQPQMALMPLGWTLGLQAREVGHWFRSPANRKLARDRSREGYFLRLNPTGDWSLGYRFQRENRSRSQGVPAVLLDELSAEAHWRLSSRLQIRPYGEFRRERVEDSTAEVYHSALSVTANTWLVPGALFYRNVIKLNQTQGARHPALGRRQTRRALTGEFQWQAITPRRLRPGLDVNLSFSADRREAAWDPVGGETDYQLQLSINSRIPGA
ncbi:MAG: hypothetical protein R3296_10080 [Oleiphilaceae bacterium]|nr:hypothetical protein [Oleiphilaceae bacterium]